MANSSSVRDEAKRSATQDFLVGLARACGGALVFSLPMLMTMEMWWLGIYADRLRLALFIILAIPLLIGLSHYSGFEPTFDWKDDTVDAFVAYAVAFVMCGLSLLLLGIITPGMAPDEIVGKIAIQAVPASIGALLAASQFASGNRERSARKRFTRYAGELFLMAVGALFLALNVAPTEEMVVIAHHTTPWHIFSLIIVSLIVMHAFVYALEFSGQEAVPEGTPTWSVFLRYTLPGYSIALLISVYILWTFGRTDHMGIETILGASVVLAVPGSIGAAAARLII